MAEHYVVSAGAGTLFDDASSAVVLAHPWTGTGVSVATDFTGGHVLHLAVAACVLNDVYREAERRGVELKGVHVTAEGGFEGAAVRSTGVEYGVTIDSGLEPEVVEDLLRVVDEVAEVPQALRAGVGVRRVGHA